MKRLLLISALLAAYQITHAATLIEYDMTPNGTPTVDTAGFTGIVFAREDSEPITFSGIASSGQWQTVHPATAPDPVGDFYKFSITNNSGSSILLTTVSFQLEGVGSHPPLTFALDSTINNLSTPFSTGNIPASFQTFTATINFILPTATTETFYLYGNGSTSGGSTLNADNVLISGVPTPECDSIVLALGGFFVLWQLGKFKKI